MNTFWICIWFMRADTTMWQVTRWEVTAAISNICTICAISMITIASSFSFQHALSINGPQTPVKLPTGNSNIQTNKWITKTLILNFVRVDCNSCAHIKLNLGVITSECVYLHLFLIKIKVNARRLTAWIMQMLAFEVYSGDNLCAENICIWCLKTLDRINQK